LPIWAALTDWLEKLFHLCLVSADGCGNVAILTALGGTAALLKWSLLAAWLLAIGWIAARTLSNRLIR
jgi:hypothetical protein